MEVFQMRNILANGWDQHAVVKAENLAKLFMESCCSVEGGWETCYLNAGNEYPMLTFPFAKIVYADNFLVRHIARSAFEDGGYRVICSPLGGVGNEDFLLDMGNIEDLIPFYKEKQELIKEKARYEEKMKFYPVLLQVAKKFDRKEIRNDFLSAFKEAGISVATDGISDGEFRPEEAFFLRFYINDKKSFLAIPSFGDAITDGKFDYPKFEEMADYGLKRFEEEIIKLEREIEHGKEEVQMFNQKEAELFNLCQNFSFCFRDRMSIPLIPRLFHTIFQRDIVGAFEKAKPGLEHDLRHLGRMRQEDYLLILLIARQFDGQPVNTEFFQKLKDAGLFGELLDGGILKLYNEARAGAGTSLLTVRGFVSGNILDEKGRLNFEKFKTAAEDGIKPLDMELTRLKDDIKHGFEKYRAYVERSGELEWMFRNMSQTLQHFSRLELRHAIK